MSSTAYYEFSIKLLEKLGLDPDKVASYTITGSADGVVVQIEWIPDDPNLDLWTERYVLTAVSDWKVPSEPLAPHPDA